MDTNTLITEEQKLVMAQLNMASSDLRLFVGGANGTEKYTRDELLQHVRDLDEVGLEFIKTQMDYLRSFKDGDIASILSGE